MQRSVAGVCDSALRTQLTVYMHVLVCFQWKAFPVLHRDFGQATRLSYISLSRDVGGNIAFGDSALFTFEPEGAWRDENGAPYCSTMRGARNSLGFSTSMI